MTTELRPGIRVLADLDGGSAPAVVLAVIPDEDIPPTDPPKVDVLIWFPGLEGNREAAPLQLVKPENIRPEPQQEETK